MTAFAELKSLENLVLFWGLFKGVPICFCLSHLKCYLSSIFLTIKCYGLQMVIGNTGFSQIMNCEI